MPPAAAFAACDVEDAGADEGEVEGDCEGAEVFTLGSMSCGRGVSRAGGVADVSTAGSTSCGRGVSRVGAFCAIAIDDAAARPVATINNKENFVRMAYPLPGAGCAGAGGPAGGCAAGAGTDSVSVGAASDGAGVAGFLGVALPVR